MPALPEVGIGIVGYGLMGRVHAAAYRAAPQTRPLPCTPLVRAISGRDRAAVTRAAAAYGIPEWTDDWRRLIDRDDIQVIDICTPAGHHAQVVEAAAAAGKAILCEKPLAATFETARSAAEAARQAGVLNAIGFNYRHLPALAQMARMIEDGAVGRVRLFRGTFLTDEFCNPETPWDWRFDRSIGGSSIADLGAHLVDAALWMVGDITEVVANSATFVPERLDPEGHARAVDVDEASSAMVRFQSDATGTFEVARTCVRRPCDFTIEVNGTTGTLLFDYSRLNELWFGAAADAPDRYGMQRIRVEHQAHPEVPSWWPLGQGLGYEASFVNQACELFSAWPEGPWAPDLEHGLRVQAVCSAMELSAAESRWVAVGESDPA